MKRALIPALVSLAALLGACGRDTNFDGITPSRGKTGDEKEGALSADRTAAQSTDEEGDPTPTGDTNMGSLKPKDQDYLRACLSQWKDVDFGASPKLTVLSAQVSVGGGGMAIVDKEITQGPALYLVKAAVNVLSATQYLLGNPNGYYCIKANVNVLTGLEVQVACHAHLASNKVGVNVGSVTDGPVAGVGVDVLSKVKLTPIAPEGYDCNAKPASAKTK